MNSSEVILIVENDVNDLLILERSLRRGGVDNRLEIVHTMAAAKDYLAGAGEYRSRGAYPLPALILLDLDLPIDGGFHLLRWIRSRNDLRDVLVLVLGTSKSRDEVARVFDLGANGYFAKGLHFDDLADLIRELDLLEHEQKLLAASAA